METRIGFPGTPAYISSKFALEGLSECMRYELSPFGIKTIIIEPGVIQTNFFSSMKVAYGKPGSPYKEITEKVMNGVKMMDPNFEIMLTGELMMHIGKHAFRKLGRRK